MSDLSQPADEVLYERSLAGDEPAFTALYRRRQGAVYRFALQMSGSAAVAEEVTQEVFLLLIREPQSYDPSRGPLLGFLYGVARNLVRRSFTLRREVTSDALVREPSVEPSHAELERQERVAALRQAVLALPANYREVVVLCDFHEMPYEQAAQVLGCPVGTVRSRLHRARSLLMARLAPKAQRCMA